MTGIGAEFLSATGGSLSGFASAAYLSGCAGLAGAAPVSGKRTGNLHRPRRHNRQLQRVYYTSAIISIAAQHREPSTNASAPRESATTNRSSP